MPFPYRHRERISRNARMRAIHWLPDGGLPLYTGRQYDGPTTNRELLMPIPSTQVPGLAERRSSSRLGFLNHNGACRKLQISCTNPQSRMQVKAQGHPPSSASYSPGRRRGGVVGHGPADFVDGGSNLQSLPVLSSCSSDKAGARRHTSIKFTWRARPAIKIILVSMSCHTSSTMAL